MPITDEQVKAAQEAWGQAEEGGEDRIDELWRAALEAADAVAWQPIETAPSGSAYGPSEIFLVCGPIDNGGAGDLYIAKARSLDEGPEPIGHDDEIDAARFFNPAPTHWRPPPEPPKDG